MYWKVRIKHSIYKARKIIMNRNKGGIEGIIEEKIFLGSIILYKIKTKSQTYKFRKIMMD